MRNAFYAGISHTFYRYFNEKTAISHSFFKLFFLYSFLLQLGLF